MNDRMNRVKGKLNPYRKYTLKNREQLKAPISTALTETNFIIIL